MTVCKVRPGLEQYGLVEAALNWIDPTEDAVKETVLVIESFVSSLFEMNAATILASGTGTKLVAFLYLDGTQGQLPKQMAERFDAIMTGVKDVINELMAPLLGDDVVGLEFLDVNSFFAETAINWLVCTVVFSYGIITLANNVLFC